MCCECFREAVGRSTFADQTTCVDLKLGLHHETLQIVFRGGRCPYEVYLLEVTIPAHFIESIRQLADQIKTWHFPISHHVPSIARGSTAFEYASNFRTLFHYRAENLS